MKLPCGSCVRYGRTEKCIQDPPHPPTEEQIRIKEERYRKRQERLLSKMYYHTLPQGHPNFAAYPPYSAQYPVVNPTTTYAPQGQIPPPLPPPVQGSSSTYHLQTNPTGAYGGVQPMRPTPSYTQPPPVDRNNSQGASMASHLPVSNTISPQYAGYSQQQQPRMPGLVGQTGSYAPLPPAQQVPLASQQSSYPYQQQQIHTQRPISSMPSGYQASQLPPAPAPAPLPHPPMYGTSLQYPPNPATAIPPPVGHQHQQQLPSYYSSTYSQQPQQQVGSGGVGYQQQQQQQMPPPPAGGLSQQQQQHQYHQSQPPYGYGSDHHN
ncbi:unnamed protein product [Ambrosiozyma monospora]|uniref:Unnamed protein product n=1 Tax=Ambrosiozyma monospora TaxID=43982 RepID=A0A9W6YW62_AMBMO|nr:unnamed protein product [Ambrosiozyma monospora]